MSPFEQDFINIYYGILAVLYPILNLIALRIVRNTRWHAFTRFLIPAIIGTLLELIYRTILSAHLIFGLRLTPSLYATGRFCVYIAHVFNFTAILILIKTLRQTVNGTLPDPRPATLRPLHDPHTWPPPPTAPP